MLIVLLTRENFERLFQLDVFNLIELPLAEAQQTSLQVQSILLFLNFGKVFNLFYEVQAT